VYQSQKVHLVRPSLSFPAEARPRLRNRRGEKAVFGTLRFSGDRTNYKAKVFNSICYQLANKTRNLLLFAIQITYLFKLFT
jgi:hypothetical protein